MIYVGGDGFAAASYAQTNFSFSKQDKKFLLKGLLPHPANIKKSFATHLSNILHAPMYINAYEDNSFNKIIRDAQDAINYKQIKYLILTFPNFFRGEILHHGNYVQFDFNTKDSFSQEIQPLIANYLAIYNIENEIKKFNSGIKELTKRLDQTKINYCFIMSNTNNMAIDSIHGNWLFDPKTQSIKSWSDSLSYTNDFGYMTPVGHLELAKLLIPYLTN